MFFRRLIIRIRIAFIILTTVLLLSAIGGIVYLNHQGLNEGIRTHISEQLEKNGVYVTFDSLKYKLSQGLVAENVTVYTDETHTKKTAYLPSLIVNMDKTKLLRGKSKINSLALKDGSIELPLDIENPDSEAIRLEHVNGKIEFLDDSAIVSDNLTAIYENIGVSINCHLWQKKIITQQPDPDAARKREAAYRKFLTHLRSWKWEDTSRPTVDLSIRGDVNDSEQIHASFSITAPELSYENDELGVSDRYEMNRLEIHGEFSHHLLTIDHLHFLHNGRDAQIIVDYDFSNKNGKFNIDSTIQAKEFVGTFFGREIMKDVTISGNTHFNGSGSFQLPTQSEPITKISIMGNAEITKLNYLGSDFDFISSDFAWKNGNIYLNNMLAQNPEGELTGRLLIKDNIVTYDVSSSLPLKTFDPFIKQDGNLERGLSRVKLRADSKLNVKSHGVINAKDLTDWHSSGSLSVTHVGFKELEVEKLDTDFKWENGLLDINNLHIVHKTGELKGDSKYDPKSGDITFSIRSNLRPETYIPLLSHNKNAQEWIRKVDPKGKEIYVLAHGYASTKDRKKWGAHGELAINNLTFEGVPLKQLKFGYDIERNGLLLNDVNMMFDYSDYSLRKKYNGPEDGKLRVDSVDIKFYGNTVTIKNAIGNAYPAQVVRMFVAKPAQHVEQYEFHGPPAISATGVIGVSKATSGKTNFNIKVNSAQYPMNYKFLGGDLRLKQISASVSVLDKRVKVDKIKFNTLGGRASGNVDVRLPAGQPETYTGYMQWQQIDFRLLGIVYKFDNPEPGKIQGNILFSGVGDDIRKFNSTRGTFSLTKGNIFSVPLFGPLSNLINAFLPGKVKLNERIKTANANFVIKKGILYSNDLICPTPSLSITGQGWIDLKKQTVDLTVRVNFRGLMGLLMLPVKVLEKPLGFFRAMFNGKTPGKEGLLQFRGTGLYKNPNWRMVPFQPPPKNNALFKPPRAILIQEPPR